eukprot:TRINITY_DN778_c0_g1_i4.p1 TRINITY_DN778_c0_g1~~TRINITY_DN778_c0_g1_i4.p1  ORF type:complete len:347 (+),score=202.00 TRINITY_DN778_c0_g1_i4:153-1193(+)
MLLQPLLPLAAARSLFVARAAETQSAFVSRRTVAAVAASVVVSAASLRPQMRRARAHKRQTVVAAAVVVAAAAAAVAAELVFADVETAFSGIQALAADIVSAAVLSAAAAAAAAAGGAAAGDGAADAASSVSVVPAASELRSALAGDGADDLPLDTLLDAIATGPVADAVLACRLVALLGDTPQPLVAAGALDACARRAATNDGAAARAAALTLIACTGDAAARAALAAPPCDAVLKLVRVMGRWPSHTTLCERAMWAVSNFARDADQRTLITDMCADVIVTTLSSPSDQALISALKTILLCAQDAQNKRTLRDAGGVLALRELLERAENSIIRTAAERALAFLAQ